MIRQNMQELAIALNLGFVDGNGLKIFICLNPMAQCRPLSLFVGEVGRRSVIGGIFHRKAKSEYVILRYNM